MKEKSSHIKNRNVWWYKRASLMYCFNFFKNQLWRHLLSYNSFKNRNMCLLEVAMCENAEAAISSWRVGVKSLRTGGRGNFTSGGVTDLGGHFYWGTSTPLYAMLLIWHIHYHQLTKLRVSNKIHLNFFIIVSKWRTIS